MAKSSTGLEENAAALISYAGIWVTGLIFFLIEKDSKFVKFHAMQSMIVFFSIVILWWVLSWILHFIWWLIGGIIGIACVVLWIILMVKAYQGEKFKLPFVGDLAEKWSA